MLLALREHMLLNQGDGVFHPNQQQWLAEQLLKDVERNDAVFCGLGDFVAFHQEKALLHHVLHLLLLCQDLVLAQEFEHFSFRNLLLALHINRAPRVFDQLHILAQSKPVWQVEALGALGKSALCLCACPFSGTE